MDLRDIKEFLIDSAKYIIIIVIVLLIGIFVISFQQVVGPSMSDTLTEGNVVLINKFVYHLRDIKRGEIVSINVNDKVMVKRIIGLPGESIEYKDNDLYINGKSYEDKYGNNPTNDFKLSDLGYDTIPEGYYFVLGDNRGNSQDSRDYGLIKKDDIVGKVFIKIFPFNDMKVY